jgi:hypothetical protein
MTALDKAVEVLQDYLEQVQNLAALDVSNLWQLVGAADLGGWSAAEKQALIAALRQYLPDVVTGHAAVAANVTSIWYEALAPGEPYSATVPPDDLVPPERIAQSISWAVNTATTAQTALARLQGTVQRAVLDAHRATVAHNAALEGVRYRRHANYAGACNWCLTMATRGAIYKSAASAVRGHDNCKCIAVPERPGTSYTVPAMVRDAQARYLAARAQLEADGQSVTLDAVVARIDALQAKR